MKNEIVAVIYDRKKTSAKRGIGKIEMRIYLSRTERKYITLGEATPQEWEQVEHSDRYTALKKRYQDILTAMNVLGEEMTIENFNVHAGIENAPEKPKNEYKGMDQDMSFLDYMEDCINSEDLRIGTRKHKIVVLDSLRRFGKIKKLCDLTPANIMALDKWLHDGTRTEVTIYGYHKNVKTYTKQLRMADMIPSDPYDKVKIKRGKSKERQPLTENELKTMRETEFNSKLARVRDLFIFSAYTGLAFCDAQSFNFHSMTEKHGDIYYIVGDRLKTGSHFITPILQPAMDVLERYDYQLPKISNQKGNDYLHVIQAQLNINKPLTFHVARHSFATLCLSHDIPIENVARMLGHQDVKTTQIYASAPVMAA